MSQIEDALTDQFYRWELRGRGWGVADFPVGLEPPFRPFKGHFVPPLPRRDDGRRHTFTSRLLERLAGNTPGDDEIPRLEEDPEPKPFLYKRFVASELQLTLPRERKYVWESFESLLLSLSVASGPIAFEIVGNSHEIVLQFASDPDDCSAISHNIATRFSGLTVTETEGSLTSSWTNASAVPVIAEFGLQREFVLSLGTDGDWLPGLFASLSALGAGEVGLLQIIFVPVRNPWAESALTAVSDGDGGPFFVNRPELLEGAKKKLSNPLFAVILRFAAKSDSEDRSLRIVAGMASGLSHLAKLQGNRLVPLSNDEYPDFDHEQDLLRRQTHRPGMLLNLEELAALLHFPSAQIQAPKLRQDTGSSRTAPQSVAQDGSIILGENTHAGTSRQVSLSLEQRVRHSHIIGASGTGKSTLLFNLIRQDIENGQGVGVLDPHGDLIDRVLDVIPKDRVEDVVLVDPADEQFSVGFNILSAHSDFEKTLLASDLVSVFQRLSTSWGDQMGSVLNNAILAFLESGEGGTLADLRRFLLDPAFRKQFLLTVNDPDIVYYWEHGFPQLGGNKSIGPVITRLESFLAPKPIRYMVSQKENKIDFADITDSGRIFLARLPQGQMGCENAYLLGSLFVSKFQQTAMARQRMSVAERRPFWLYIDEFPCFITPSMAEILSGARKYRLGLTLAHQDLNQLRKEQDVASAVLSNACTRIVFRVSDSDAKSLESGFAHFKAEQLQNLDVGKAICRIERSDADFNLSIPFAPITEDGAIADVVRQHSRERFATPRTEIEALLRSKLPLAGPAETLKRDAPALPAPNSRKEPNANEVAIELKLSEAPTADTPPAQGSRKKAPHDAGELGRGGGIHRDLQQKLKLLAESLGFRATIEKQLPGTLECTDLLLEREGVTIAIEITVTNTIDYELKNIRKCIRAGVSLVAVVAIDSDKLSKLEAATRNSLASDELGRVQFFLRDTFSSYLQELSVRTEAMPQPDTTPKMHKGWKVKTTVATLTPDDIKEREAAAAKLLMNAMKRLPGVNDP